MHLFSARDTQSLTGFDRKDFAVPAAGQTMPDPARMTSGFGTEPITANPCQNDCHESGVAGMLTARKIPPSGSPVADTSTNLRTEAAAKAKELGFDWFGVARAELLAEDLERLTTWIGEGRHASMEWLARDPERRCDPQTVLPGCQSVVVVGMNYNVSEEEDRRDPQPAGKVARYARGRDYHRVMDKPLKKLARFLNRLGDDGTRSKPYVDHGPVMERQWAVRAGLGFAGKHTLLINPLEGSWFFLGVVLTTLKLEPTPPPTIPAGCGDCHACIDACPTDAIVEPWKLDARRCISYLTIEHKGEIDPELAERFNGWVFGCDICQEVCPYNRKRARPAGESPFSDRLVPAEWSLAEMLDLTEEEVRERFSQSPVRRTGAEGLQRNARIVLSNVGKS